MKLWEANHEYYCADSGTQRGQNQRFDSWEHFIDAMDNADPDLNLLFRWDWIREKDEFTEEPTGMHTLRLCFLLQRKGLFVVVEVSVFENEEQAILEYLQLRFEHLKRLWLPLK